MKKDKKFLLSLESNLSSLNEKDRSFVLQKYRNIIDDKLNNGQKITTILKEIGPASEVALKEISIIKSNKKSFKNGLKKFWNAISKDLTDNKNKREKKEKIKKEAKEDKKDIIDDFANDEISLNTEDNKKNNKKEKKKIKKEAVIEENVSKDEIINDSVETNVEVVVVDNVELKDNKTEVEENKVETEEEKLSKKEKGRRFIIRLLTDILVGLLLFIWMWSSVIFIASCFAFLDGVRIVGINIAFFGLDILILWLVLMIIKKIYGKSNNLKLNIIVIIISVLTIAFGIALTIKKIYSLERIEDVSVKYSMTNKKEVYNFPVTSSNKMYVTFNSNYDTQYTINYDDTLKDKFRIEVKYYECYYDYYIKQTSNNIYVSLKLDDRDRISTIINDLKDNVIYDSDELSRYTVRISINKADEDRLVILD